MKIDQPAQSVFWWHTFKATEDAGFDVVDCWPVRAHEQNCVEARLRTFSNALNGRFPRIAQDPKELALSGFVWTTYSDRVRCVFCSLTVSEWDPEDDILSVHAAHSPQCPGMGMHVQEIENKENQDPDAVNTSHELPCCKHP